jgi:hypothetical protein
MKAFRDRLNNNHWICPNPIPWNTLWEMLPGKKPRGSSWEPSPPLILAAWDTPHLFKRARFFEHLDWADQHCAGNVVLDYLETLSPTDWYTG